MSMGVGQIDLERIIEEKLRGLGLTDIRGALREELDDLYLGEVEVPEGWGSITCVVEHPDGQVYAVDNMGRIGEMDDPYRVSKVVKTVLGFNGGLVKLFYDDVNDGWLMAYQRQEPDNRACIARLDREFNVVAKQEPILVDGEQPEYGNNELGAFIQTLDRDDKGLFLLFDEVASGVGSGHGAAYTPDFSKTPLPEWTWKPRILLQESKMYDTYNDAPGHGFAIDGGTKAVQLGHEFCWLLQVHHGYQGQLIPAYALYDREKDVLVAGYSPIPVVSIHDLNIRTVIYGFALTGVWRREFYLYITKLYYKEGRWGAVRRIHVYRLPRELLDPTKRPVIWHVWINKSIETGETSPAIPGFGRKTIFFTSDTAGDLTAYLDAIGINDWKELFTLTGITSALEQTTFSGLRMRFKFSASAKVSLYVVAEP